LSFSEDKLRSVTIHPQKSKRERVDVYLAKTRLSGLDEETLAQAVETAGEGVTTSYEEQLESVTFS
ncbi:hypothetical protein NMM52_20580, partial [Acinetobacter baumannii]|nr:hypothetical protein [Acinetobacter baumannii]